MKSSFLIKQIDDAKFNFSYFLMTMIIKIFKVFVLLATVLLINQIFDTLIINMVTLIFVIISIFIICSIIKKYNYILKDIKNTFGDIDFCLIIDTSFVNINLFKGMVKYGK